MDTELFVRQILVDGIGAEGQRAIANTPACVGGDGFAHEVACTYAMAAGFARIEPCREPLEATEAWMVDPSARDALTGARAALRSILHACDNPCEASRANS